MKKIIILLFFIFPLQIFAQLPHTTYITGYTGLSIPTNHDVFTNSFNAGANIEFAMNKLTVLGFDFNFANLSSNVIKVGMHTMSMNSVIAHDYGNYSTIGFITFLKLQNADAVRVPVQPFVKLGLGVSLIANTGMSNITYSSIIKIPNQTSTRFLISPGMGFNLMLHGKDKITFEVQYRMNKSDTQSTNAFLLNAGFGFRL